MFGKIMKDLVLDIWTYLIVFLDRTTAARLSRTCHTLRSLAIPIVLQVSDGVVLSPHHLVSFYLFMEADPSRRFYHLRSMRLSGNLAHLLPDPLKALLYVLEGANMLQSLSIESCDELLDGSETFAQVLAAVSSLPKLKHLGVQDIASDPLYRLLSAVRCPLSTVNLRVSNIEFDFDALHALGPHRETLRELSLSGKLLVVLPSTERPAQFTQVYRLIWLYPGACDLSVLLHCFPNLCELTFVIKSSAFLDTTERRIQERYRRINIETQRKGWRWNTLDYLEGFVADIYMLAVQAPVKHLKLTNVRISDDHLIPEILASSSPELFTAEVTADVTTMNISQLGILLGRLSGRVTTLNLELWVYYSYTFDIEILLRGIFAMSFPALAELALQFHNPSKESIDDPDTESIAKQCMNAVPTLKSLTIYIPVHNLSRSWEIVVDTAGNRALQSGPPF